MSTLVKSMMMSFRLTWRVSSVWTKLSDFLTLCKEFPSLDPSRLTRCFASLYVGVPVIPMMGLRGTPELCILWNSYNMGGLEPCVHSCMVTSRNEDLLLRSILCFTNCVWGLWSVIYILDLSLAHPRLLSSTTSYWPTQTLPPLILTGCFKVHFLSQFPSP